MKKLFSILAVAMILCSSVYADKILKSGYLIPTKKWADKIDIDENLIEFPKAFLKGFGKGSQIAFMRPCIATLMMELPVGLGNRFGSHECVGC